MTKEIWNKSQKIYNEYIRQNKVLSRETLSKELKISDRIAGYITYCLKYQEIIIPNENLKGTANQQRLTISKLNQEIKKLYSTIDKLQTENETLLKIKNDSNVYKLETTENNSENEAVAIAILSDIHFEEHVDPATIDGLNEYNTDIARIRLNNYFLNLLKQVNNERKNIKIDTLVLGFLGDFITGYIHEELKESNLLSPTEAILEIKEILLSGLKYLYDVGKFKKIIIPCCKGNHGRNTKDKRFATAYKNSYEWLLYNDLSNMCKIFGLKNIEFVIPKSELTYLEIFDKVLRFGHGDHFRYAGGVGGLMPSMMKYVFNADTNKKADMNFFGHWHQSIRPSQNIIVNGSLIGYNAYAYSFQLRYEKPSQQMILLDKKRGFTTHLQIYVD